jgi:carboxyl-terminal processing protease
MVVLVNGLSASASELFGNAMQDYQRAIIIGNTTLGKASMQQVFPLENSNNEFVKITLEKFYRITGKSNQYIGLIPNVEIPSLLDKQMPREKTNASALKNDEIELKLRYSLYNNNYSNAIQKSKERINNAITSKEIETLNAKINPYYETNFPPITLRFENVFDDVTRINQIWNEVKKYSEKEYPIQVEQNRIDLDYQKFDDFLKTISVTRSKTIKQNFATLEAVNILTDLIEP